MSVSNYKNGHCPHGYATDIVTEEEWSYEAAPKCVICKRVGWRSARFKLPEEKKPTT